MISKAMQDAINDQINKELYSSYLYLSMAAYFENKNLPGFAKWMHMQEGEERGHAMKLYEFLVDRGGARAAQAHCRPRDRLEELARPIQAGRRARGRRDGLHPRAVRAGSARKRITRRR